MPARAVRGVVSLDTAAFDVAAKADPARNPRPRLFWNAFGTPQEEAADPRWASASPINLADRGDPAFLLITQRRPSRVAENRAMLRALGNRRSDSLVAVALDHAGINRMLGSPRDATRETEAVMASSAPRGAGAAIASRPTAACPHRTRDPTQTTTASRTTGTARPRSPPRATRPTAARRAKGHSAACSVGCSWQAKAALRGLLVTTRRCGSGGVLSALLTDSKVGRRAIYSRCAGGMARRRRLSEALDILDRALRALWSVQFRIPPVVYWLVLVAAILVAFFVSTDALRWVLLVAALCALGVGRWRWHQRRKPLVVVPRFSAMAGSEGRARRAQELIMESLAKVLTPAERALVHDMPVTVGPTDLQFASRLRRRMHALYVVYGRIDDRADGGWSVFAGVAQDGQAACHSTSIRGTGRRGKQTGTSSSTR